MKKEISGPVLYTVIGSVVVIVALAGFFLLRDTGPVRHPSSKPNDKVPAAPAASEPPEWFKEKIRQNSGK